MPEPNTNQPGRPVRRAFVQFVAVGCLVGAVLTPCVLGQFTAAYGVPSILTAPGVLLTLPLHNAVPGGGWGVLALMASANGLVYGLVFGLMAGLFVRIRDRRPPPA